MKQKSLEIKPHLCRKLSFYKDAKAILWRRDSLFNNGARKIKYLSTKKKNFDQFLALCKKKLTKLIIDLSVKPKIIKLPDKT